MPGAAWQTNVESCLPSACSLLQAPPEQTTQAAIGLATQMLGAGAHEGLPVTALKLLCMLLDIVMVQS